MVKSNIKGYQRITSNIYYMIQIFNTFLKFRKAYSNGFYTFRSYLNNNTKINVRLKNKASFIMSARATLLLAHLLNEKLNVDIKNDTITIKKESGMISEKEKIIFYNGIENGDIYNIFIKNEYSILSFKGKIVVDIGTNIGDSAIYFALNGAKKIIGLEPFNNNYNLAKKNVMENSFEDKCEMVLAGCSGKSGSIKLNQKMKSDVDSKIEFSDEGEEVRLYSLDQIIKEFSIPIKSILKMDCEGCEYESIIGSSKDTLRTFDEILLEYHHGYLDLKEKLETCGFYVSVTKPISTGFLGKYLNMLVPNKEHGNSSQKQNLKPGYSGLIHASQKY